MWIWKRKKNAPYFTNQKSEINEANEVKCTSEVNEVNVRHYTDETSEVSVRHYTDEMSEINEAKYTSEATTQTDFRGKNSKIVLELNLIMDESNSDIFSILELYA
jgi:hypothetical protein